ncbi:hypothetical protein [Persephonella sp.]
MLEIKDLRRLKIVFKKDGKILDRAFFDRLIENTDDKDLKNFLIGCRHTVERHYTEALKWFLISGCDDSRVLIILLSYKLGDDFLFDEYYEEDLDFGETLKKLGIEVYLQTGEDEYRVDKDLIRELNKI